MLVDRRLRFMAVVAAGVGILGLVDAAGNSPGVLQDGQACVGSGRTVGKLGATTHRDDLGLERMSLSPEEEIKLAINILADCLMSSNKRGLREILVSRWECNALPAVPSLLLATQQLGEALRSRNLHLEISKDAIRISGDSAEVVCSIEVYTREWGGCQAISKRWGAMKLRKVGSRWKLAECGMLMEVLGDVRSHEVARFR